MRRVFIAVAVLTVLWIGVAAWLRPADGQFATGLSRERFWVLKLQAPAEYQVVLAGDSRVLCDLDPDSMETHLNGLRALNFGFNYAGLTEEYLDAAVAKLKAESTPKALLIGVSPRSLTPLNTRVSGFLEEKARPLEDRLFGYHLNSINNATRPLSISSLILSLRGRQSSYKDCFTNGWLSVSLRPPDPSADLQVYKTVFENNRVSDLVVSNLVGRVRSFSKSGIRVFGIRLPISDEIRQAEDQLSGFDESAFRREFEDAGGVWLQSIEGNYVICDGSHLDAHSARAFSGKLAQRLRDHLANPSFK